MKTLGRISTSVAACALGLSLAGVATAVDLRDWGRKFPASQRFVVLPQFNNQAILDKETQLVWQATASTTPVKWLPAYISCLSATTGGRRGWRLPTFAEFASAMSGDSSKSAALNGVPNGAYWTATDYPYPAEEGEYAISIIVPSGNYYKQADDKTSFSHGFWCVRGPGA